MKKEFKKNSGFTLLEMSLVIVIIALLVGGIMLSEYILQIAALQSAAGQITRYRTAVTTFKLKYNAIPGDLKSTLAASFSFATRTGGAGHGDGNNFIKSANANGNPNQCGEANLFWNDMGKAGLIESYLGTDTDYNTAACGYADATMVAPAMKIGDNTILVAHGDANDGQNYLYIVGGVAGIGGYGNYLTTSGAGAGKMAALSPIQASWLDQKFDDGIPFAGKVTVRSTANYGSPITPPPLDTAAAPGKNVCVSNATDNPYNLDRNAGGETIGCVLRLPIN